MEDKISQRNQKHCPELPSIYPCSKPRAFPQLNLTGKLNMDFYDLRKAPHTVRSTQKAEGNLSKSVIATNNYLLLTEMEKLFCVPYSSSLLTR